MRRRSVFRSRQTRPNLPRPRGLRLEWLEDRTVPANLTLSLLNPAILEGASTTATLTRTGDLSLDLTVLLDSGDPSEVTLPGSAVIPAGEASASFLIGAIDDTDQDGVQSFNILAWTGDSWGNAAAGIRVLDNDSPPTVQPDAYDAGEDETLTVYGFGVVGNDFSYNGNLTATVVTGPAHGTLSLDPGGGFTYTPAANYHGPDSFVYRATDEAGLSGTATVSLTVWGMNDPLQLNTPGPQTTAEDTPLAFSAADANAITLVDVDSPRVLVALLVSGGRDYGILTLQSTDGLEFPYPDSINNSPSITFYADDPAEANAALEGLIFTPAVNYNGPIRLDVLVQDTTSQFDYVSTYVPITVTPVADAPVAVDDAYEALEDGTLVAWNWVLSNDVNVDAGPFPGDGLTASLVSGPSHGTLTLNPNGSFTYTPAANYNGPDSFVYRATNAGGLSDDATATITVQPGFDFIEFTLPDPQTTAEDTPLTFSAANGNAVTISDPDGGRVEMSISVAGTLSLQNTEGLEFPEPNAPNNSPWIIFRADSAAAVNAALEGMVFTPMQDLEFDVNLSMMARDLEAPLFYGDAFAYLDIAVTPVNDAPTAAPDGPYTVEAGEPLTVDGGGGHPGYGVLQNDWDVDWDYLSAVLVSGPAHGTLTLNPDGKFTYTADPTYSGTDTFTYRASDGELTSDPATVTIDVTPRNWPPVTSPDSYSADEDSTLAVGAAQGVLANDHDPEGLPLAAELLSGPSHGTLTLNADGGFTYTSAANNNGPDEFWYRATDGARPSAPTLVTLTVNPVNDAPVNVVPGAQTLVEDTTLTFSTANGNAIRLTDIDAGDAPVELRLSANGFLTFPTTAGLTFVTGSNGGNLITVQGTLADINAALDGLVFCPGANFVGTFTLQVRTSDLGNTGSGGARLDTDNITLTITPVNDAPQNVVPLVTPVTAEDTPLTFNPWVWVTDVDQTTGAASAPVRVTVEFAAGTGSLSVTPSAGVTITGNGTVQVVLQGTITNVNTVLRTLTFTPAADANNLTAPVQIRVTTDDLANGGPGALTDTDVFGVSVTPVNDTPLLSLSATGVSVAMNGGAHSVSGFATGAVGPATATDEPATQTLSFGAEATGTTGSLAFAAAPSVAADGTLSFAPAAGTWGTATVRVWSSDGVAVSPDQTFIISVTNTAPTTDGLPPVPAAEDAPPASVTLSDYFADAEDNPLGLTYAVVDNANPGLFGSVSVSGGVLTMSFAPDANGAATLIVRATDSGGLSVDTPLSVGVAPVNDAPNFAPGSNVTVASDAGPQTRSGWATAISRGPANESAQALGFDVWADNPLLFAVQPAIDPATGTLSFTPVVGAAGTATVTVVLRDDGGTANVGVDASAAVTFTITLTPPAATPGMQVVGTELIVTGGTGNDTITITTVSNGNGSNGAKVTGTLNGQSVNKTFRQTLTRIRISAGAGNDTVNIADGITLPTVVDGGAGADSIKGGGGADLVFGGDGNDTINAAAGDDDVDAGAGNDSVTGGLGRDLLSGGTGDDTVQGGDGNDFLIGGLGADQLFGQNGDDILVAGSVVVRNPSTDSLRQVLTDWDPALPGIYTALRNRMVVTDDSNSIDRLQGDAGTDWFWSWDSQDVLDLESGEQRN